MYWTVFSNGLTISCWLGMGFTFMCFCFSAWGESLFMSVQTTFLVVMYFYYTKKPLFCVLFPVVYSSIFYALVSGLTPMSVLVQLVSMQVVFIIISRVSVGLFWLCFGCVFWDSARNSTTPIERQ